MHVHHLPAEEDAASSEGQQRERGGHRDRGDEVDTAISLHEPLPEVAKRQTAEIPVETVCTATQHRPSYSAGM